ncbi:hypothetical protein CDD83_7216 [Cordyceps sp. RAO-2017]|nr:hypothetical protein CDD83_7216 [Cordyceps sp. RAO-2017]
MARYKVVQFLALSCILSFNHVSRSLKRYSLTEQPHLSTCVVLFLAGCICFAASRKSKWIAFGDGRFTAGTHRPCDGPLSGAAEDEALLNGSTSHVPNRPRRFSLPALILCVVLRLELFHLVNYQQQCSSPGIEAFLCLVLIGYEIFSSRRRWGVPPTDDAEDPWRSVFDDLYDWFTGPRVTMVVMLTSACLFSLGTYLSISQITRSTYICFAPADSQSWTLTLQLLELVLDATIVILFWRILAWARTVRLRLRVLASVFVISSLVSSALWLGGIVFRGARQHDAGFGSLHGFDFLVDSVALAIFTSSALFWICETSPITPVSVITFFVGTWSSILNVLRLGDWMHLSIAECLSPIWLIAFGTVLFLYTHDVRSVAFCERPFLTFLLMLILCVATIVSFLKRDEMSGERHPINDLMYQAQTEHHRWLLKAGTSQSLPVAVKVYEESHAGRMPPPNFSEWYQPTEKS